MAKKGGKWLLRDRRDTETSESYTRQLTYYAIEQCYMRNMKRCIEGTILCSSILSAEEFILPTTLVYEEAFRPYRILTFSRRILETGNVTVKKDGSVWDVKVKKAIDALYAVEPHHTDFIQIHTKYSLNTVRENRLAMMAKSIESLGREKLTYPLSRRRESHWSNFMTDPTPLCQCSMQ